MSKKLMWKNSYDLDGSFQVEVFVAGSKKRIGFGNLALESESLYEETFEVLQGTKAYGKITAYDYVTYIHCIEVEPEFKGLGIGRRILELLIEERNKTFPDYPFFLNACPYGHKGLDKIGLVNFYKKSGFKVLKDLGGICYMWQPVKEFQVKKAA